MEPDRPLPARRGPLPITRFGVDRATLATLLEGEPAYRARQVWTALYRNARWPPEMTELPAHLRARLAEELPCALDLVGRRVADRGETVKLAFSVGGGAVVEAVLMAYPDRVTLCVSTQAGCAMGCSFCATGQGGFTRNLASAEIVEQVAWAMRERRVTHVVAMGMGEPLANYANTLGAMRVIHGEMGISARRLTISTVGVAPCIKRLADEDLAVNLAVSLHAANDALRDKLVPLNSRYPLKTLIDACKTYIERTGRRISFEWAVIGGVNDSPRDARELAELALGLGAHVNLIALNPTSGFEAPKPSRAPGFARLLKGLGVNVTVRATRGRRIGAACGQLAYEHSKRAPGASVPIRAPRAREPGAPTS